ncbi:HAD-IA family hydrolase [Nocardia salmonicida]
MSQCPHAGLPHSVILFDLDGTLVDSAPGLLSGFRHALATVDYLEPDDLSIALGPPMIETFRALRMPENTVLLAFKAYTQHYDRDGGWKQSRLFEGVEPLLDHLTRSGARLAIATSKREVLARRVLDYFNLTQYFQFVGGASTDQARRHKADVIEYTLQELGVAPSEAAHAGVIMVGDRIHDIHGAARWGIDTIHVAWGYGSDAEASTARWHARTIAELGQLLGLDRSFPPLRNSNERSN